MIAPTQAQIEAAKAAIEINSNDNSLDQANPDYQKNLRVIAVAALTAAAQVGEPTYNQVKELDAVEAAAIERCAQVAESFSPGPTGGKTIAAAIRKLANENQTP